MAAQGEPRVEAHEGAQMAARGEPRVEVLEVATMAVQGQLGLPPSRLCILRLHHQQWAKEGRIETPGEWAPYKHTSLVQGILQQQGNS